MPQSNVIFFYLFAAFFVFITMRGELPKYLGFLLASPSTGTTSQVNNLGPLPDISKVSSVAQTAAAFLA